MSSQQQLRHREASKSDGNGAITGRDCKNVDVADRRRPGQTLSFLLLLPFHFFARFLSSLLATWRTYRRWRSTRLRDFGAALPPDSFPPPSPKSLATDEALSRLKLTNSRDVAGACTSGTIVPGRLFRSSSPFSLSSTKRAGGDQGEDGNEDVSAAAGERARLLSHAAASPSSSTSTPKGLNLSLVIDLRSDNEWEQGKGDAVIEALLSSTSGKKTAGDGNGNKADEETDDNVATTVLTTATTATTTTTIIKVERVPLQEWRRYLFAFVARLPLDRALGAASHFFLFKFVLRYKPPLPGMHSRLCVDTERGGILAMNTTVLAAFPLEIARVLRLITSALSSDPSSSVMIACKLGKDRTGMISALCLAIAGASFEDVVTDYSRSAVELSGRPPPATAPSLGGAPRAAMERTLEWLAEHWGSTAPKGEVEFYRRREKKGVSCPARYCWRSGVIGYLEHEARFLAREREALRRALTE